MCNEKSVKIVLDDGYYTIDFDYNEHEFKDIRVSSHWEYDRLLQMILAPKQWLRFVSVDTARTFRVSRQKLRAALEWKNSEKNPYRERR
jgi:hypothetical protein